MSQRRILNYEVSGSGPVIVLLHGYLCSLHYWDNLRATLEKNHTVVAIDLLGFGDSQKPRRISYGYEDHVDWIRQTLDDCNLKEPFTLAGHSMGALLALRYAATYPESTEQLLLMNMPLFKNAREARQELAGTSLLYRVGLYWGLHRVVWPLMRNAFFRVVLKQLVPAKVYNIRKDLFVSTAVSRSRSLRNVIETQSSLEDLEGLKVSTTLVVGKRDRSIYQHNLKRLMRTTHLEILLTDTGHHTPIENPGLSLKLVSA